MRIEACCEHGIESSDAGTNAWLSKGRFPSKDLKRCIYERLPRSTLPRVVPGFIGQYSMFIEHLLMLRDVSFRKVGLEMDLNGICGVFGRPLVF